PCASSSVAMRESSWKWSTHWRHTGPRSFYSMKALSARLDHERRVDHKMDLTVISTFRCNSKCQMCYIWQNPTEPKEEVSLETLSKLPPGFDNLNVSGGEPTLRKDLAEIADILH